MLALGLLALSTLATARPLHRTMPSLRTHAKSLCTFPDGSSPKGQPEMHCADVSTFLQAYGIDKVHQSGLTGKGQTLIFVDSYGSPTLQADLDHFSDTFGLPKTTIQFIYPNGTYTNPLSTTDQVGWAQETTLDLEWAHAVAPDAALVNIVTSSDETYGMNGLQDIFNGIQMAVKQYPHAIISMSFGTGEATFEAADIKASLQGTFHQILQDGTNADFTFLASAGDSGSAETNIGQTSFLNFANASYPASDPLITAVGGTALQSGWAWNPEGTADDYWACQLAGTSPCPKDFLKSSEGGTKVTESVWKEDWALAAGGGGISTIFSTPNFQEGLDGNVQKLVNGYRAIPDVAYHAAINGGVEVYTSFKATSFGAPGPTWQNFGGTSCASPETAGLVALAGELASQQMGKSVGIGALNPIIYSLPNGDFNDIVSQTIGTDNQVVLGDNGLYFNQDLLAALGPAKVTPVAVAGFATTEGFDLATGFGSPVAAKFVQDVAAARAAR